MCLPYRVVGKGETMENETKVVKAWAILGNDGGIEIFSDICGSLDVYAKENDARNFGERVVPCEIHYKIEPSMKERSEVADWLWERFQNCVAIAAQKEGQDRVGWLEDSMWFERAIRLVDGRHMQSKTQPNRERK